MSIPGFTGETSLYRTHECYRVAGAGSRRAGGGGSYSAAALNLSPCSFLGAMCDLYGGAWCDRYQACAFGGGPQPQPCCSSLGCPTCAICSCCLDYDDCPNPNYIHLCLLCARCARGKQCSECC